LDNFSLTILEYVDTRELAIEREQYWIDEIDPIYNILRFAGSSLGYKHTGETKEKMRYSALGRKHSEVTKILMSELKTGELNSMFGKFGENNPNFRQSCSADTIAKMSLAKGGNTIFVYSSDNLLINSFESARKAAKYFNCDHKTILKYAKNGQLFKDEWVLSINLK
jgi:group I intron endonuclease